MTISKRIKEIREAMGWTQAELANKLLVERNTVTRWEMGIRNPTESHLLLIELVTGMKIKK